MAIVTMNALLVFSTEFGPLVGVRAPCALSSGGPVPFGGCAGQTGCKHQGSSHEWFHFIFMGVGTGGLGAPPPSEQGQVAVYEAATRWARLAETSAPRV